MQEMRGLVSDQPSTNTWVGSKDLYKAEEAAHMMRGIGSRLDFHVCKIIADLRYVLRVCFAGDGADVVYSLVLKKSLI